MIPEESDALRALLERLASLEARITALEVKSALSNVIYLQSLPPCTPPPAPCLVCGIPACGKTHITF